MTRPVNASRQTRKLLSALAAKPRAWRHGYELSKQTGLTSGTLYPSLMRLSDQGFLESKWGESEGTGRSDSGSLAAPLPGKRRELKA
jgi:PadR family transcriptional regulator PadR